MSQYETVRFACLVFMPKPLTTVHEGSTRGKASPNYVNRVKEKAALLALRRTVKEGSLRSIPTH